MKKVTAVVPMKLNNRRLPQKNTKSFTNGKPLCYYILSTLLKIDGIDDVYVYCSNPDIREFIPEGVKYLKRSESLDTDSTKMNDVLKSFAMEVDSDIYVMTHTTAPFVKKESIIKGIQAVLSGEKRTTPSQPMELPSHCTRCYRYLYLCRYRNWYPGNT